MASSLIRRICVPDSMEGDEKIPVHGVIGVTQEIMAGRMPAASMSSWLSAEEVADANTMIAKITAGELTLTECERILMLGERGIYTVAQIETIFGLA